MPRRVPAAKWLERIACEEVDATIEALPEELRAAVEDLPVTLEPRPNDALLADGLEPGTLGLFVGEPHAETGNDLLPLPAQIILFLESIWDFANGSERTYRAEVRKTYLHELGHYLGLDEDDLFERGME